ncbi:MAG: SixA phosphatase family protein [Pyrinomonadaceae bacterium]
MKRLFVLRHAKSDWSHASLTDFERPLNRRGTESAVLIGAEMKARNFKPEYILSSPAARAKQTVNLVTKAGELEAPINLYSGIYEASTNTLFNIVSNFDDNFASALIVGHNPGFEGLVEAFTDGYERMPTAALAVIDFNLDSWRLVGRATGVLYEIIRPREIL